MNNEQKNKKIYCILINWCCDDDFGTHILFTTQDKEKSLQKFKKFVEDEKKDSWICNREEKDIEETFGIGYYECNDSCSSNFTCIRIEELILEE